MVCGFFIIQNFIEKDTQGFANVALANNVMDENLQAHLYLPPYLRPNQADIQQGSKVFAIADEVTGYGSALFGADCDITYQNKADYRFTNTLTVDGNVTANAKITAKSDIKSTTGDVLAGTISLKNHIHPAVLSIEGEAVAGVVTGTATGNTGKGE